MADPFTMSIFAWAAGSIIHFPDKQFDSYKACNAARRTEEKRIERSLADNYRINVSCAKTGGESLKEMLSRTPDGRDGWRCFKYGECHGNEPDVRIGVDVRVHKDR